MGIELLERVVSAGGRILKAEQLIESHVAPNSERGVAYLLTFDVGCILVAPDRERACLVLRHLPSEAEGLQLTSLAEEEPWWKVIGNSLNGAWPCGPGQGAVSSGADPAELRLQFRADDENPKIIVLVYDEGRVRVAETGVLGSRTPV